MNATSSTHSPVAGFGTLFDRVSVTSASNGWSTAVEDVTAVCGEPDFSDGTRWATWGWLSVSDEAAGPAWCLLARMPDLAAVVARATELGWKIGAKVTGEHERRVPLFAPSGLTVVAYAPESAV